MRIGIGLPTTTPGATRDLLVEWARRADDGPFSTLAVLDRLVYDSFDPFGALALAAGITDRIRLATMIAIAPLRSAGMLVKEAATVHAISDGRLTLGVAVGARLEDYEHADVPHRGRGRRLSDQLAQIRGDWADSPLVPGAARGEAPELLVGGNTGAAFERMARYADGYAHNGGPPRAFASSAARASAAWTDFGRPGRPRLWGQAYFALGDEERGTDYLRDYYAFTGPFAEKIAAGNLTSPRALRDLIRGYEEEGCDELVLFPTVADIAQLARLMEALPS
jgi:alkanesulfonate monooxygenase SsuD/methylene tetrahydromethanopterin reductase-like flavin-dependent oxidoreductase (luciferase family)